MKLNRFSFFQLGCLLLSISAHAQTGLLIEKDIDYLGSDRTEKADLYRPAEIPKDKRVPAVLIIHGGGWSGGDKGAAREQNIGTNLVLNGYVALSINYVLAKNPGTNVVWPQNLYDCKTAVRWLRKNADRLQINPDRIGVIGGSAGGHLATMVALTDSKDGLDPKGPYDEFSSRVQCGVNLYGPVELMEWKDISAFRKSRASDPELYRKATPSTYADPNDPPVFTLHGTADTTVDVSQAHLFDAAMKKANAKHELLIVEGAPHTFHLQPKQKDLRPVVIGFFDKHLKN